MTIGIQGIRIKNLSIENDNKGMRKPVGSYELVGTNGRVLATQTFNQYGGVDVMTSPDTARLMDAVLKGVESDISGLLGLVVTA